jgi:hypothetical protein
MASQVLLPRMQHQRESRFPAEMARIGGELGQGGRSRREQRLVDQARSHGDQTVQRMGQREHQMEVRHRQQLAAALGKPGFLGAGLALRTVPVAAGMMDMAKGTTNIAAFDMAAQGRRAAGDNGPPGLCLGDAQGMTGEIRRAEGGEHPGQTGRRRHYGRVSRSRGEPVAVRRCRARCR